MIDYLLQVIFCVFSGIGTLLFSRCLEADLTQSDRIEEDEYPAEPGDSIGLDIEEPGLRRRHCVITLTETELDDAISELTGSELLEQ